jgi:hypothetical protein
MERKYGYLAKAASVILLLAAKDRQQDYFIPE